MCRLIAALSLLSALWIPAAAEARFEPSGQLEIHYINVGQGGCTLIIGPDGTRVLYDFGKRGGRRHILPYLEDVLDLDFDQGIHYTIVSHRDSDHYNGYRDVFAEGKYDVLVANYGPGSPKTAPNASHNWLEPAEDTTAGTVRSIPVGLKLSLGDGAELLVVAANGKIYGGERVDVHDENDRSVVALVRYGKFQYILDGDVGGGAEDCTEHDTGQMDVQSHVADALIAGEEIDARLGVDVMHVSHHGSESSTPARYYNKIQPEVAVISVGRNQGSFRHPRVDVVERVLLDIDRPDCVEHPPVRAVFQTEAGKEGSSPTGATSFAGTVLGNIVIKTDGETNFTVEGSAEPGVVQPFAFDEDLQAPSDPGTDDD